MNPDEARMLVEALDAFPGALVVVDARGHVLYSNTRAAVWDCDPPRLRVGQPLPDGFPGWIDAPGAAEVRQAVTDRASMRVVEPAPRLEGRLETAIVPAADGVLVWVRKVAPSEEADQERSAVERQGLLIEDPRRLAHDLMQPLGSIINYAELIRGAPGGDVQRLAGEIMRIATTMAASIRERLGATGAQTAS
jgi:hypothetical protein